MKGGFTDASHRTTATKRLWLKTSLMEPWGAIAHVSLLFFVNLEYLQEESTQCQQGWQISEDFCGGRHCGGFSGSFMASIGRYGISRFRDFILGRLRDNLLNP